MDVSKMVVDREKSAAKVTASARTHASKAGQGMAGLLGADFGGAAERLMQAAADKPPIPRRRWTNRPDR